MNPVHGGLWDAWQKESRGAAGLLGETCAPSPVESHVPIHRGRRSPRLPFAQSTREGLCDRRRVRRVFSRQKQVQGAETASARVSGRELSPW